MDEFWQPFAEALGGMSTSAYLALVIVVGVACQWLAWRLRIPSLLLLLLVGFGIGQVVRPEEVLGRDALFGGVEIAVGIILFEGSLSLRFKHVRDLGRPILRLCTVTVVLAWLLTTASAWLVGFDVEIALLVGAILVVTGPTVINPILRSLRPTRRASQLLRWEGIVVDPIGAVLALLVFQGLRSGSLGDALPTLLLGFLKTLLIGFGIAVVLGVALAFLMRRHAIPDFLQGVVFLAAAVGALIVSNHYQPESGLLTVTVLGVFLGNQPDIHLEDVREFKEHLQVLLVGALFVVLAGRVSPEQLWEVAPQAVPFLLLLLLVVRPVSIWLGLWGTKVTRAERTLLSGMAPRGIVAAAVTSIFALELGHAAEQMAREAEAIGGPAGEEAARHAAELADLAVQAEQLVPLVLLVIVVTVTVYGLGVGRLAERLSLAATSPQGVLFAGVNTWVVEAAQLLQDMGVQTLIVARQRNALDQARRAGLTVEPANILSEFAVQDMDLAGIGSLVACTPHDETNATATREFAHVFGRARVFQLQHAEDLDEVEETEPQRGEIARHLTARYAFAPAVPYDELERRVAQGHRVRRIRLTSTFSLRDFRDRYGDEAIVMFVHRGGQTTVAHQGSRLPQRDAALITLVPDV
jgi:NhaP-type Na+/H+ or K+/H+ antiporter